jgi:hypothetical protein
VSDTGRLLIVLVACLLLVGVVMVVLGRQLPGDLVLRRGNLIVYFPLGLSIALSVVLTLVLNVLLRGR